MADGISTKNSKFYYNSGSTASPVWTQVNRLIETPTLGGTRDKIEVTCLEDTEHKYINGLTNYGDTLTFKFRHDGLPAGNYATLSGLTGTQEFKIAFNFQTSGSTETSNYFTFSGEPSVSFDALTVGGDATFTLNIAPQSAIVYA